MDCFVSCCHHRSVRMKLCLNNTTHRHDTILFIPMFFGICIGTAISAVLSKTKLNSYNPSLPTWLISPSVKWRLSWYWYYRKSSQGDPTLEWFKWWRILHPKHPTILLLLFSSSCGKLHNCQKLKITMPRANVYLCGFQINLSQTCWWKQMFTPYILHHTLDKCN